MANSDARKRRAYNRAYSRALVELASHYQDHFTTIFAKHYTDAVREVEAEGVVNHRPGPRRTSGNPAESADTGR